ncbi:MAG TPA: hypothetical protein VNQ76_07925 [Planctomicrobium sp.]|nr:hypothetical protein [Planctomicrobium sp.]
MKKGRSGKSKPKNSKIEALSRHFEGDDDGFLSTNQGLSINDNQNSLKAGERGPSVDIRRKT